MTAQTWMDGKWLEGNPMILGPMSHAMWLGSTVFDGARAFEGVSPDLDLHCERIVSSAHAMGLNPQFNAGEILELASEGVSKFSKDTALYIRPMFWATEGFVDNDPTSTQFCVSVYEAEMPEAVGFTMSTSRYRRPSPETALTEAKAACHYPHSGRALRDARVRGFDNALMLDPMGAVAELATANIFMAKDGDVFTPISNGTFLNGITRQRIINLLKKAGVNVYEAVLRVEDFENADEIFSTGNWGKVMPVAGFEDKDYQPGPLYKRARELYWEFAHNG